MLVDVTYPDILVAHGVILHNCQGNVDSLFSTSSMKCFFCVLVG